MKSILNTLLTVFALMTIIACVLVSGGCTEAEKITEPPVFGTGDPSPEYIAMFGNGNGARLNFIQEQNINKLMANVYGFKQTDKDGKVTGMKGFIERVSILEAEVLALMKQPEAK